MTKTLPHPHSFLSQLTLNKQTQTQMEKQAMISRTCHDHHQLLFAVLISFLLCSLFLSFDYSSTFDGPHNGLTFLVSKQVSDDGTNFGTKTPNKTDSCSGRYVYIHDLPPRFNHLLIENCKSLTVGTDRPNMCPFMENMGLGPEIQNSQGVFPNNNSWYETNQFLLEVIFHNKMRSYNCLTNDSSLASAIFVPFYAGLDVSRFLWVSNITVRDASSKDLVKWLASKPEWKRMWGRDHFLVCGRISWDFRRRSDENDNGESNWGSKFRFLPESMNMSMLAVEGSSWNNDYAIPYPTSFHPKGKSEVLQWQDLMRRQKRPYLFTFTGAPRPELEGSIRGKVIEQCRASNSCKFIDCSYGGEKCDDPVNVMKAFGESVFCLQPPGDSYTRRSIFDSMVAGCIPVFFHPGTAYSQYKWNLPKNGSSYSVYIPVRDVREWNVSVEKVLTGIGEGEVVAMREEVIKLIPSIIYADPRSSLDGIEDAFDLAVKGVLERVEEVREEIRNGRDPSIGFADEDHYKYTFSDNHS